MSSYISILFVGGSVGVYIVFFFLLFPHRQELSA